MRSLALLLLLACVVHASEVDAAAAGPVAGGAATSYRLFPGDLLHIQVYDHPDLETRLRVPSSGTVAFPLIGDVTGLVGRPTEDLTAELQRRLLDGYIRHAVITVTIEVFGPRLVTVVGNVKQPGALPIDPQLPTSAMQMIGKAGGFLEDADRERTLVVRADPADPDARIGLPVPAKDDPEAMAQDVRLAPGDLIVVPRLNRVFVIGQVKVPRAFSLPNNEPLTVSKSISLAGGFEIYAKPNDVQLIRAGKRVQVVRVRDILTGDAKAEDPRLEAGDTVFVPETRL